MREETNTIGARIKECRKAMGLSQEALAELLYMKKNTICRYENDEHDIPSSNIVALAKALNTTPDYLLLGKTEEDPWMKDVLRVLGSIKDPAMNGIMIKCHTHKCTRGVTLKNFTEGQIVERTDALGKCYL